MTLYARDFLDAQEDLLFSAKNQPVPARREFFENASLWLSAAQRFHVPYGLQLAANKPWSQVRSRVRLPFPAIAIHSLVWISGRDKSKNFTRGITLVAAASGDLDAEDFLILSLVKVTAQIANACTATGSWSLPRWLPFPAAICRARFGPEGMELGACGDSDGDSMVADQAALYQSDGFAREWAPDFERIIDLTLLLGLSNVSTEKIEAPLALQKARLRKDKPLLPHYHALRVGGELWHNERNNDSSERGEGYRSHMRRGHVRNLPTGREVWVRDSFVHGSKSGFVGKEYHVA